ncbi:cell surface composition regulator GlgS [Superficieibacter sp.]|uniref:cell surface composition regulator GlgS n=1 Tax=Superficieibacter sp. TaxID=2303322 RepID=UPI0028A70E6E|nr:cell surface composition regulator GlgS [Superficieibacter sp.]
MNEQDLYSVQNFDFLARSFARMSSEGRQIDIRKVTGNMDEEHRSWFCQRYEFYQHQAVSE